MFYFYPLYMALRVCTMEEIPARIKRVEKGFSSVGFPRRLFTSVGATRTIRQKHSRDKRKVCLTTKIFEFHN